MPCSSDRQPPAPIPRHHHPTSSKTLEIAYRSFTRAQPRRQVLRPSYLSALGKTFALVFALLLEIGLNVERIRFVLASVRAVLSDWGVEAYIADHPDVLPDVLDALVIGRKQPCARLQYTFPCAILMPGSHHIFDNIFFRIS